MKGSEVSFNVTVSDGYSAERLQAQNNIYKILIAEPWDILRKGRQTLLVSSVLGEVEINPGFIAFSSFNSSRYPSYIYRFDNFMPNSWLFELYEDKEITMSFPLDGFGSI